MSNVNFKTNWRTRAGCLDTRRWYDAGTLSSGMSYRCEGVITDGKIDALKVRLAGQNMDNFQSDDRGKPNDSSGEGFLAPYYDSIKISAYRCSFWNANTCNVVAFCVCFNKWFCYESFIDELAHEAEKDPLEFRRQHLQNERCQRLIDKMEEVSGWKNRKKNEGFGVAITECFSSTVGDVVKVSKVLMAK